MRSVARRDRLLAWDGLSHEDASRLLELGLFTAQSPPEVRHDALLE
jgi:hypothetical protein